MQIIILLNWVVFGILFWIFYDVCLCRGKFAFDRQHHGAKFGGKTSIPFAEIRSVDIVFSPNVFSRNFAVYLNLHDKNIHLAWFKVQLYRFKGNVILIADLLNEVNADKLGQMISDFTGVPVQHQATFQNSV